MRLRMVGGSPEWRYSVELTRAADDSDATAENHSLEMSECWENYIAFIGSFVERQRRRKNPSKLGFEGSCIDPMTDPSNAD